jgi:hypothetical protein
MVIGAAAGAIGDANGGWYGEANVHLRRQWLSSATPMAASGCQRLPAAASGGAKGFWRRQSSTLASSMATIGGADLSSAAPIPPLAVQVAENAPLALPMATFFIRGTQ